MPEELECWSDGPLRIFPHGMAPTGSIMRWIMDGWLMALTSKAAAKRSSNELPVVTNASKILTGLTLAVRPRKLQVNSLISLADAGESSSPNFSLTVDSLRWRCSTTCFCVCDSAARRGGVSMWREWFSRITGNQHLVPL